MGDAVLIFETISTSCTISHADSTGVNDVDDTVDRVLFFAGAAQDMFHSSLHVSPKRTVPIGVNAAIAIASRIPSLLNPIMARRLPVWEVRPVVE
jgi:hypothetical protein